MNRTFKQFTFGSIYLITLILIASGIYFIYFKPAPSCTDNKQNQRETSVDCGGPCASCESKDLVLAVEEAKIFPAGSDGITLLAEIKNPSRKFSASFTYQFELSGAFGGQTPKIKGKNSVGPASSEYIVIPGYPIDAEGIKSAEFKITELRWAEDTSPRPRVRVSSQTDIDKNRVTAAGVLFNESAQSLPLINLTAVIFDKQGMILNASKTRLEGVGAFSQKQFTVFFPEDETLTRNLDPQKTEIQWELNE